MLQAAEVAVVDQFIRSARVNVSSQLDHAARYVDAGCIETEILQYSRGASSATTEIQCFASGNVLGDDSRQIAVGQIIRDRKSVGRIRFRSLGIVVNVGK